VIWVAPLGRTAIAGSALAAAVSKAAPIAALSLFGIEKTSHIASILNNVISRCLVTNQSLPFFASASLCFVASACVDLVSRTFATISSISSLRCSSLDLDMIFFTLYFRSFMSIKYYDGNQKYRQGF
jgi:hypothetical protein